jgi:hypothetical protein
MNFGPEYVKINTIWKRDSKGIIIPHEWACPEFEALQDVDWTWTEKVDGTNIRLHWDGSSVTIGGRTDSAQIPAPLIKALEPHVDLLLWKGTFPDSDDVTVYGEGYGAGIQSGGQYRPDQTVIVFDVLVGSWWLEPHNVADVASKLGLDLVPRVLHAPPYVAWYKLHQGLVTSCWKDARIEGLVGKPKVELFNRKGERILMKMKVKDHAAWQKVTSSPDGLVLPSRAEEEARLRS